MARRRQALGIIAYADAFQSTLARVRWAGWPKALREDQALDRFDFVHLRESIKVANDVGAWHRQGLFSVAALSVASTLSITAAWVAISRLAGDRKWPFYEAHLAIVQWVFYHPIYVVMIAVGIILAIWDVSYSSKSYVELIFKSCMAYVWPSSTSRMLRIVNFISVVSALSALIFFLIDFQLRG